jgi:outer membrane receptor for ferrienterochelin and colicin
LQLKNSVALLQQHETVFMKNLVLLTLFISSAFASFAQNQPAKGHVKIIGAVVDAETNQPVEFATIALIDPTNNKPVDGTVCDDKGKFEIPKVAPGIYTVSISFIGYETQNIEKITIPDKKEDLSIGLIKLVTSTKMLNEVVVEGQKQMIEERVDRTIYNAENDATTRGGDATDVLKRVPMLSVDMDGNVSLRGSQNIKILINNKPSTIMASSVADALKQIPADQIKSVEVITSPSAKYDAEGSGGIINIITKKNTLQGATLNVNAGVGLRGSNLGLNGNYRKGKMGFSLGGYGRANYNIPGSFENSQSTTDSNDNEILNIQTADTRSKGLFGNYTLGWDYDIDKKNSLAASVRFGVRNNKSYQDNLHTSYTSPDSTGTNLRDVVTNDANETVDINLTYTHLFDKPQREFSFLALYSRNNRNNDFQSVMNQKNEVAYSEGYKNLNDSYNQEITVQADYQTPIGTNQLLELGGKGIMRTAVSDYSYYTDPDGNGSYELSTNAQLSNNLNYDQSILASYLSYTLTTKSGYSLKAGTRYEYTTINAYTATEDNIEIPSYGVMVPSVNLSKKLKEGMVKIAYNRRIQRPSIQFLNPNIQSPNPVSVTQGNPELSPEYTNNYELSYSTFKKGVSINLTSFVRNTTGSIQSVRQNLDDGRVLTTYENIGNEDAYGASLFLGVNKGKLTLNGGTDIYYAVLNDNQGTQNEGWVISGRAFGGYDLGKGWGIQFFGFARGRRVQLQGSQGGFRMYSLGIKKDLKDKKGSIGIGAENFFTPTLKIKNEVITPTITQNSTNVMHIMSFRVNFSYRIGKMSVDSKPRRSRKSINNDDLKDGDGGGGGQGDAAPEQQRGGGGGFTPAQGGANGARPAVAVGAAKVIAANPAAVVDAAGTWNYTVESPQGGSGVLTIVKDGDKLTGKIKNNQFNRENDLSSIELKGNELSFSYEVSMGGNTMLIQVKAIVTGDDLSGNMAVGTYGTYPIQAKRTK